MDVHWSRRAAALAIGCGLLSQVPAPAHAAAVHHSNQPALSPAISQQARQSHFTNTGHVGDVTAWPSVAVSEEGHHSSYLKDYTLRALGPHVEVWVADLSFPEGDCRNGTFTRVTDAQVGRVVDAFEKAVRPTLTDVFGAMRKRDGHEASLPGRVPGVPKNAYRGPGDRLVVLVDNFRDDVYRSPNGGGLGRAYTPFDAIELTDRQVITIRGTGWDWLEGASPAPDVRSTDPCTGRIRFPNFVEQSLAHEYTHVLQYGVDDGANFAADGDPDWMTEGVAEWSTGRTGFSDRTDTSPRSYMTGCFLGNTFPLGDHPALSCPGGASASLTLFHLLGMSPPAEYGAATSFVAMLADRYGEGLLRDLLRRSDLHGRAKLAQLLAERGMSTTFDDLVADWSAAVALDGVLDDGAVLTGADASRVSIPSMHTGVNWANPFSYGRPAPVVGVAPNSSHYVRLQDRAGQWLDADHLTGLDLDGDTALDCLWVSQDGALYGGGGNNGQDRRLTRTITVPATNATLEFDAKWDIESGYDLGSVEVSTDGDRWTSLATADTSASLADDALPRVRAALPGFTGSSDGWRHQVADLSAYAGQTVQLRLRYQTDPAVLGEGFLVDDVKVGGVLVSDGSLDGWTNTPPSVHRLLARVVSWTDDHRLARISTLPLDGSNDVHLTAAQLAALVTPHAGTVAVVVTHLQDDDTLFCAVRFSLSARTSDGDVPQHGG